MNLNQYQVQSRIYAIYPVVGHPIVYPALGLSDEAGEVAGQVKRLMRDDGLRLEEHRRQKIKDELGDTLWYLAQVASEIDMSLEEIAERNLEKLQDRLERDKIKGEGDDR